MDLASVIFLSLITVRELLRLNLMSVVFIDLFSLASNIFISILLCLVYYYDSTVKMPS